MMSVSRRATVLVVASVALFFGVAFASEPPCNEVKDSLGRTVRTVGDDGAIDFVSLGLSACLNRSVENAGAILRTASSDSPSGTIDSEGFFVSSDGARSALPFHREASNLRLTIDTMLTESWSSITYRPGDTIAVTSYPEDYILSDGSQWSSGAGSFGAFPGTLNRVEVDGDTVRYVLDPPSNNILMDYTDFNQGDHSSRGVLAAYGPLVIEATIGSTTGTLSAVIEIISNDITSYGEPRFNYYSSIPGSLVPMQQTFTLLTDTFDAGTFDRTFSYRQSGLIDFANPTSVPALVDLEILGTAQLLAGLSADYVAIASFANGQQASVTGDAEWTLDPTPFALVDAGVLTSTSIPTDEEEVVLRASYEASGTTVMAEKRVRIRTAIDPGETRAWTMYQGNPEHSGHAAVSLDQDDFSLRWERSVGSGIALHPITSSDGRVFVSLNSRFFGGDTLFVLDTRDGETLWKRSFDSPQSVNPPTFAYGNIYIQTGNHSTDTYLHAFDAATGDRVFQSPHAAQWESYYAPTVHQGEVFVNGGYFGGMYAFDAFSGIQRWFRPLAQYDEWTPAVDAEHSFAYVGGILSAVDRQTGTVDYTINDPNFQWRGWSMNLAPVLGNNRDVFVIQNGRLVCFDLETRTVRYDLSGGFVGQPATSDSIIYALKGSQLVAIDALTGAQQWSWTAPSGPLTGAVLVTDTHVFTTTNSATYGVEILSRSTVWQYPAGGHLTISDDVLYIASRDRNDPKLTAINLPEYVPATLIQLEIEGPTSVVEFGTGEFTAWAHYDDGRIRDRTQLVQWTVQPSGFATLDTFGVMSVSELFSPTVPIKLHASYTEDDITQTDAVDVELVISVSIEDFVVRNVTRSIELKQSIGTALDEILLRETAARDVAEDWFAGTIGEDPPSCTLRGRCLEPLDRAIIEDSKIQTTLSVSVERLLEFLDQILSRFSIRAPSEEVNRKLQARPREGAPIELQRLDPQP